MAATLLSNCLVLVNGADLSGHSNRLMTTQSVEELDSTTFSSAGWKERAAGLASHEWEVAGFWEAGDAGQPDNRTWTDLGVVAAWTGVAAAAEGSTAYFGNVLSATHAVGDEVGKLAPFSAKGVGSGRVVRGSLLTSPGTARTATGNGTAQQLGALSASQAMWTALHVCSVSGTSTPTVTVKLQSASTSGGSYTDRVTFTAAAAISSQLSSVTGAVTDTWWRAQWTITGTSPSFLLAVVAGIV